MSGTQPYRWIVGRFFPGTESLLDTIRPSLSGVTGKWWLESRMGHSTLVQMVHKIQKHSTKLYGTLCGYPYCARVIHGDFCLEDGLCLRKMNLAGLEWQISQKYLSAPYPDLKIP